MSDLQAHDQPTTGNTTSGTVNNSTGMSQQDPFSGKLQNDGVADYPVFQDALNAAQTLALGARFDEENLGDLSQLAQYDGPLAHDLANYLVDPTQPYRDEYDNCNFLVEPYLSGENFIDFQGQSTRENMADSMLSQGLAQQNNYQGDQAQTGFASDQFTVPNTPLYESPSLPYIHGPQLVQNGHHQIAQHAQAVNNGFIQQTQSNKGPSWNAFVPRQLQDPRTQHAQPMQQLQQLTPAQQLAHQLNMPFTSLQEAEAAMATRRLVSEWKAVNDITVPKTQLDRIRVASQLLVAMEDISGCDAKQKGALTFKNRWEKPFYKREEMAKVCWKIVEAAERLHTEGPRSLSIYDLKALTEVKKSRNLTFAGRIDAICEMLRTSKSRCDKLMKGETLEMVVGAPQQMLKNIDMNATSNSNRAKFIQEGRKVVKGEPADEHSKPVADAATPQPQLAEAQPFGIVGPMPHNPMDQSGLVSRLSAMADTITPQSSRADPTMPRLYNPSTMSRGEQYPSPPRMYPADVGYLQSATLNQKRAADEVNIDEVVGPPAKRHQHGG
jgi:hypothetical protein